jgi:two-component system, NtrC family, sensor kinase
MAPQQLKQPALINKTSLFFISEHMTPPALWGATHYKPSALQFPFFTSEPLVLVIDLAAPFLQQFRRLLSEIQSLHLQTQIILFSLEAPETEILNFFNQKRPFRLLDTKNPIVLQRAIEEALEYAQLNKQEQVLYELFKEQNKELQKISQSLEERIEKRQAHLEEARAKLSVTNEKNLFLQKCLFAIHNSTYFTDLEKNVMHFLKESFSLDWFRIHLGPSSLTQTVSLKEVELHNHRIPLINANQEFGQLIFARKQGGPFRRDERDFLEQLGQAISLSVERLLQIERNKDLQMQWQSTFNAISDPVCLIDEDYNLRLTNQQTNDSSVGRKCYEALFQRTSPCPDCQRGKPFRLREHHKNTQIYDVFSQSMVVDYQKSYFHLYRDISQQLSLERQLVESAKLAELGTISSSIAHELNNPLGGMINFIQLLKMDLPKNDSIAPDIDEMEKAALRCKDIVKNLLSFSRTSGESEFRDVALIEVIHRAIMITELKTRSQGVRIDAPTKSSSIIVRGRFNSLAQVFCNLLQNAYESILEKRKRQHGFPGCIQIFIEELKNEVLIRIVDDGVGLTNEREHHFFDPLFTTKDPEKHSGLGLTLARQILNEHSSQIQLTSQKDGKTCAEIHFPRLSSHNS